MKTLMLVPMIGVGPFKLGAPREQVRSAAAQEGIRMSHQKDSMDYFFENAIQVEYESDGTASFIGVSSHPKLALHYHGHDLFDAEARTAFRIISEFESSRPHEFDECEYLFPDQIITLYEADEQYDYRGGELRAVWGQIGVGNLSYLDGLEKIKQKYKN